MSTYNSLITSEHRGKPKFEAFVDAVTRPLEELQTLLEALRTAHDLDMAVGAQLDHVGEWVGRSRYLRVALTGVYFSWGEEGTGWGEGAWKGLYDPDTGMHRLQDDMYRVLLKAKIAANGWNGTTPGMYEIWQAAFADTGSTIIVQDNQDMSMVVGIAGMRLNRVLEQLLVRGYIPLKPEGVRISYYAVTPDGGPLFAWGCQSDTLDGWGAGRWPVVLRQTEE